MTKSERCFLDRANSSWGSFMNYDTNTDVLFLGYVLSRYFGERVSIAVMDLPRSVVAADLDGDGDEDLVVCGDRA